MVRRAAEKSRPGHIVLTDPMVKSPRAAGRWVLSLTAFDKIWRSAFNPHRAFIATQPRERS